MQIMERSSGVLAPLFSLPGSLDIGTLGLPAVTFLNFLQSAKQSCFQTLPINPVDESGSPYAGRSAFAGEVLYLDLEELYRENLIPKTTALNETSESRRNGGFPLFVKNSGVANYQKAYARRRPFWNEAFERYRAGQGGERYRRAEETFYAENKFWLDDYALYQTAADVFNSYDWSTWPTEIRRRDHDALDAFAKEHVDKLEQTRFLQLVFDVQWREFRQECAKRQIKLFGDVPIYVGQFSADVWAHPELFMTSPDGRMIREGGSAADDYNPDGQRWNSPTYRWSRHVETDFSWWKSRMKKTLERFDMTRLDHFIGFYNYYSFPSIAPEPGDDAVWNEERNAAARYAVHPDDPYDQGWTPGPQERFFDAIFSVCPREAFVAEDLGVMKPGVTALREHYNIPGMRVFQFSFENIEIDKTTGRASSPLKRWPESSVGYTGTHDGAPVLGWLDDVRRFGGRKFKLFENLHFEAIRSVLRRYRGRNDPLSPLRKSRPILTAFSRIADILGLSRPKLGVVVRAPQLPRNVAILHAAVIRAVADTQSRLVIFPLQDVLGLTNDSRLNYPGVNKGAWKWRVPSGSIIEEDAEFLAQITEETARNPRTSRLARSFSARSASDSSVYEKPASAASKAEGNAER